MFCIVISACTRPNRGTRYADLSIDVQGVPYGLLLCACSQGISSYGWPGAPRVTACCWPTARADPSGSALTTLRLILCLAAGCGYLADAKCCMASPVPPQCSLHLLALCGPPTRARVLCSAPFCPRSGASALHVIIPGVHPIVLGHSHSLLPCHPNMICED